MSVDEPARHVAEIGLREMNAVDRQARGHQADAQHQIDVTTDQFLADTDTLIRRRQPTVKLWSAG